MQIHSTSLIYEHYPSIYPVLESVVFMWVLVIVSLSVAGWVVSKLWYIHSIPKHLAKERGLGQAKLIFWLCILGLFYKPLWILAVLAIVIDWEKLQQWIRGAVS